jgi:serine/threonine protein kinase
MRRHNGIDYQSASGGLRCLASSLLDQIRLQFISNQQQRRFSVPRQARFDQFASVEDPQLKTEVVPPNRRGAIRRRPVQRPQRDTRLKRDVAIKVLRETVAADPERFARFQREAEVLAALNHPHIAAIYGFEDSGETHALVMELVEGETLADRLRKIGKITIVGKHGNKIARSSG